MYKFLTLFLIGMVACTPTKVVENVEEEKEIVVIDPNDPCRTWIDLPNKDDIIESHVLYRDFLKQEEYEAAFPYWEKAFIAAPMADGNRMTHYNDGILLHYHFFKETGNEEHKDFIMQSILPQMRECVDKKGETAGRQAFDLYYNYPDLASEGEILELFKLALDELGEKTPVFVLNPFMKVLTDMHLDGSVSKEEAQVYSSKVDVALRYGLSNCKGDCESWNVVAGYVPSQFDRLESVKGFFDCSYYTKKYYAEFKASPEDCDVIDNAYLRMKWGDCDQNGMEFKEIQSAKENLCKQAPIGDPDLVEGRKCLESGDYNCAMKAYGRYVEKNDDAEKKAIFTLRQAKIAFAHLKNYPKARKYARIAAKYKAGWGAPYMLIGNLYASSGPLCGPGTGWDSQLVTWPAIDKWQYAKRIDPSVSAKANRLIGKYQKFMPSVSDIFQRGLKQGQSFKVGCWINETTIIRAAKG